MLDLGFFKSIQVLQHQSEPKSINDLIEFIQRAFEDLEWTSLDDVFLSLQMAMRSSIKCSGGNNYKLEHMSKKKLRREETLMESITCLPDVLQSAFGLLNPMDDQVLLAKEIVPTKASIFTL